MVGARRFRGGRLVGAGRGGRGGVRVGRATPAPLPCRGGGGGMGIAIFCDTDWFDSVNTCLQNQPCQRFGSRYTAIKVLLQPACFCPET